MPPKPIAVVGAGLVGALTATLLSQRGFQVTVFEKRPDPRRVGFEAGRSINLALAERGLHALRVAGLEQRVRHETVMMRGRMVHDAAGQTALLRYGVDDSEVIWSVSRGGLTALMLDAADAAGARIHFDQTLLSADVPQGRLTLRDADGVVRDVQAPVVIGADGAGSAMRRAMHAHGPLGERVEELGHAYKELEIPPTADPAHPFAIEPNALHVWPRGHYMCIALPNPSGSFTVTLFLPRDGDHPSFRTISGSGAAQTFFKTEFPDALALMPGFSADWDAHPVGMLATLYLDRWHIDGKAVLLGDAAHAIVPFHGQGMNCGFEDAVELTDLLAATPRDTRSVFEAFQAARKPNADAIAQMALENYLEMRDKVSDPHFLRVRELGGLLAARAPSHFMPRYRMVTFTHLPYAYALQRGKAQDAVVDGILRGHASIADVDLDKAVQTVRAALPPLPPEAHRHAQLQRAVVNA
jgi:kynurenine 3-monooxygenase